MATPSDTQGPPEPHPAKSRSSVVLDQIEIQEGSSLACTLTTVLFKLL